MILFQSCRSFGLVVPIRSPVADAEHAKIHVKCDEMRQQCVNCLTNERHCSYASEQPILAPRTSITNGLLPQPQSQPVFSLQHMSLLVHVTTNPAEFIMCDELSPAIISDILKPALEIHYVMDALHALSALQHSLQNPSRSTNYRLLSIQFQGRAFSLHNDSAIDSSAHGILPRFMFSLLLGYSSLHDTLSSSQKDITIFIKKFGDYLLLIHLDPAQCQGDLSSICTIGVCPQWDRFMELPKEGGFGVGLGKAVARVSMQSKTLQISPMD
ncbi:hypothetical protein EDB81DRAFT_910607 [Dactylonectria macrodidyma]|uniref:Zn(2)-C6 fungal-type domain-containing protein n=1 Tax=Dactylonectria macrodidyma TaxID=307937 RepID=A0A9P9IMM2_9HYPO|nr:hypothetical protein EDB81DRAFT_910607 [Dactylonectria macrodidyma]